MNSKTDKEDTSCDDIAFLSEIIANFILARKVKKLKARYF